MAQRRRTSNQAMTFDFAAPVPAETEVEAYGFIRKQLGDLGWIVKNPSSRTGGQVWTQNQCLAHPEIK